MGEVVEIPDIFKIINDMRRRMDQVEKRTLYRKTPMRVPRLTTTERDALTANDGDFIYNTTNNRFEGYEGGSWVDL